MLHTESVETVTEALHILKRWNPEWNPKSAMTDFSEIEIESIESVFPGVFVLICDFHREQAWERWVKKSDHKVSFQDQKDPLAMLLSTQ